MTRPDFAEFDRRARAGEALSVVFLGGSLTWGAAATDPMQTSYRALVGRRLREFYDNYRITSHDAAIGGTGSHLGIFRLERDVLRHKPDLVFVEFAVNDHPFAVHPGRLAAYEAIVRRLVLAGIPVVQGLLAVRQDMPEKPKEPRVLDPEHKKISQAYHTGLGDAVTLMRAKVASGEVRAEDLWWPFDGTHPNDRGYALYAEAMWQALRQAIDEKRVCQAPARMLHPDTYMSARRHKVSALALPKGWKAGIPTPCGLAFDFYMSRWFDDVVIAGSGAAPLQLTFEGAMVLLFGEATPKSGKIKVLIDGEPAAGETIHDGICDARGGGMHLVRVVAENLDSSRKHTLEIIPLLEKDQEFRIESIGIAGGAATLNTVSSSI
jgi:lysophospholipase L1-like esterase